MKGHQDVNYPYWLMIRVTLRDPLPIQDADKEIPESAIGFYQTFGITHESEDDVRRIVNAQIAPAGDIDWSDSTVTVADVAALDPKIRARSGDSTKPGIWYKSGRAFFAAE